MNKVSIFEHPEFGRIRTLEIDGKIWFCASDVAAALGYSNPRDAVVRHCKPMGVVVYDTPTRSAVQKIKYISEGNVYRLIAGSKLPSAEKFESWIFDELVPETLKNQKARTTYDNILRFCDDYDVKDPIRFLRAREVVHLSLIHIYSRVLNYRKL